MCVCVCVFEVVPSILATVPRIKARRVTSLCSVFRGLLHFAVCFSIHLTYLGHTGGGSFCGCFTGPPSSCAVCFTEVFFIAKRIQPPYSLVDNEVDFCPGANYSRIIHVRKVYSYIACLLQPGQERSDGAWVHVRQRSGCFHLPIAV